MVTITIELNLLDPLVSLEFSKTNDSVMRNKITGTAAAPIPLVAL